MLGAREDTQASHTVGCEFILGQHAFDGVLNDTCRAFGAEIFELSFFQTAWETAVAVVYFVSFFITSHDKFASVNDDNVIAIVNVRRVSRLVFASEIFGDFSR